MARKKKRDHDFAVIAFSVVQEATNQSELDDNEAQEVKANSFNAKELGRRGGLKRMSSQNTA